MGAVTQHQDMAALLMLEIVEDAFFLEQAGDEIEIRFAVLHTVEARLVLLRQAAQIEILEAEFREDLGGDLRDGVVLEHAAVLAVLQEP